MAKSKNHSENSVLKEISCILPACIQNGSTKSVYGHNF